MNRVLQRRSARMLAATLAVILSGCREEAANPSNPAQLFLAQSLALDELMKGRLPEAEAQFRRIIALAPDDPSGYANLGITHLRAGRFEEAERELRRARRLDPGNADIGLSLARVLAASGRTAEARSLLDQLLADDADNPRVLYALAELDAGEPGVGRESYEARLRRILALRPTNLAVRIQLLDALAAREQADSVIRHLEEVRRQPPAPPREASESLERAIELLRSGWSSEARTPLDRFTRLMELTSPYQASLDEVSWLEGPLVGRTVLTFEPQSLIALRAGGSPAADVVRFVDATTDAGLPGPAGPTTAAGDRAIALAVDDVDNDDEPDVFASFGAAAAGGVRSHMYHARGGYFLDLLERTGVSLPAGAVHATFADYDNDGRLDLFAIGADGRGRLFANRETGTFDDVTARAGLADVAGARRALFVDLDHDGDLDLVMLGGERLQVQRNNLDGTFTDVAAATGLAPRADGAAFGDFDGDGRIDLFLAHAAGKAVYRNAGGARFDDVTAVSGVDATSGAVAVAVADFDNDGALDLFSAGADGAPPMLWRNAGGGAFVRDERSASAFDAVRSIEVAAIELMDYDNDGWVDLVVAGRPRAADRSARSVFLFRNEGTGRYDDRSSVLPPTGAAAQALAVVDVDADGDQDLLIGEMGGLRLLRNDGGNANLSARIRLVPLTTGSGKNNVDGIGARLELRAGEIYQTRVVTERVTHFGLGPHLKADVLRVQWPNGVPQTIYFPGTDQDVLERESLKGSCAFLYTWDGEGFRFITDVMWRSALGMPVGIMGEGATAWAPAGASREYLRIPGAALRPRDGRYVLQLTEELWETAYVDAVRLVAVDHPDSLEVFVDEGFEPPGPVALRLFKAVRRRPPLAATDERGEDLLPALLHQDDVYVSNLTPTQYQGVVESHDLVLDLGEEAGRPGTHLFLRGWIYPTDASINVALSQQSRLNVQLPSLEVRVDGRWQPAPSAIRNIGFPSGKDKTIVVDLTDLFPSSDHRVRIRTNMQIYWDHAFVAFDAVAAPARVTTLRPFAADLHDRGFSRMYRRGGRYGPHWFDYQDVTRESPWPTIEGAFTRFGNVLPLLHDADDMYVIMGPGDETTIEFDAASAEQVPPGWTRTFLLYTEGWIKDADLNTAFGGTVEPLPFHAMRAYPHAPGESYPMDSVRAGWVQEYNTRTVKRP
jgi:tetratricopeptide (TPR) repeat protein